MSDVATPAPTVVPTQATATLIRNGRLDADDWQRFEASEGQPLPPDDGQWLVPVPLWLASKTQLRGRKHPVGILFSPDDDPRELAVDGKMDFAGVALIAVDFPVYTDGRGFSIAQILRTRMGWTGELRAVGDVMIDTIHYLARCGFDSFLLKAGHDPQLALQAFKAFTVHYQKTYPKPAAGG